MVVNGRMCGRVLEWAEVLGLLLAAVGHDAGHGGTNNEFEVSTGTALAARYGGSSVLEQHHLERTLEALQATQLIGHLEAPTQELVRAAIREAILATDMARHFELIRNAEYLGDVFDRPLAESSPLQRRLLISLLIKAADVSNPTRPFPQALDSAVRCLAEFTAQGDREKTLGLKVPPLRDRALLEPVKAQLDFIAFIVKPLFVIMSRSFPVFLLCLRTLNHNVRNYKQHGPLARCLAAGRDQPALVQEALAQWAALQLQEGGLLSASSSFKRLPRLVSAPCGPTQRPGPSQRHPAQPPPAAGPLPPHPPASAARSRPPAPPPSGLPLLLAPARTRLHSRARGPER
ncbi:putative 3'; 5'-cyclic-nucleotide phosphodiesterase regA [Paratrimastix pyriformis]|uniref:3 n=1 Tax=Paratrimastix pyriformis TaxID=342808 RepID=A0ABQ8UEG4_9EUKA|nr:putative 3'; 5'-cyclic-nucleotide phosphodiesterase regA [Paratrimastix pyriformis]